MFKRILVSLALLVYGSCGIAADTSTQAAVNSQQISGAPQQANISTQQPTNASSSQSQQSDQASVEQAGQAWAAAIETRNPEKIASYYDDGAYLLATFQNMLDTRQGILNYFKKLTKNEGLNVVFVNENIRLYGNTAINSGIYRFSYDEKGKHIVIPARYTFVYTLTPNGWMIIEHHSSVLPESEK